MSGTSSLPTAASDAVSFVSRLPVPIVYAAQDDLWSVDVATGRAQSLTDFKHGDSSPIFSPDGRRTYFLSGRGAFKNLCTTSLDGEWPVALTRFQADVSDPQPSPDRGVREPDSAARRLSGRRGYRRGCTHLGYPGAKATRS